MELVLHARVAGLTTTVTIAPAQKMAAVHVVVYNVIVAKRDIGSTVLQETAKAAPLIAEFALQPPLATFVSLATIVIMVIAMSAYNLAVAIAKMVDPAQLAKMDTI